MIKSLALSVLLSTPIANVGDKVLITKGEFKECTGIVIELVQAYSDNLYDINLDYCASRYIKRPYRLEGIGEASIQLISK